MLVNNISSFTQKICFSGINTSHLTRSVKKFGLEDTFTTTRPLLNDADFKRTFANLQENLFFRKVWISKKGNDYDNALMIYAGDSDFSGTINGYLRNGADTWKDDLVHGFITPEEKFVKDCIRCIDYSLKKTDKQYGQFEGTVYRIGCFNGSKPKQYISTSADSNIFSDMVCHLTSAIYLEPYHIILTNSGHKIFEVQKKLGNINFLTRECEVLLDRNSKFRKIENLTQELKSKRTALCQKLQEAWQDLSYRSIPFVDENRFNITFWEEIPANCHKKLN